MTITKIASILSFALWAFPVEAQVAPPPPKFISGKAQADFKIGKMVDEIGRNRVSPRCKNLRRASLGRARTLPGTLTIDVNTAGVQFELSMGPPLSRTQVFNEPENKGIAGGGIKVPSRIRGNKNLSTEDVIVVTDDAGPGKLLVNVVYIISETVRKTKKYGRSCSIILEATFQYQNT